MIQSRLTKFIMIFSMIMGLWLLYLNHNKTQKVTSYELSNSDITVIDIDLSEKNKSINLTLIFGVFLISIALVLVLDTYVLNKSPIPVLQNKLTIQEKKVVALIKQGRSNKEIASDLSISISTVKTHINNIFKKLHIQNRSELLSLA